MGFEVTRGTGINLISEWHLYEAGPNTVSKVSMAFQDPVLLCSKVRKLLGISACNVANPSAFLHVRPQTGCSKVTPSQVCSSLVQGKDCGETIPGMQFSGAR